MNKPFISVIMPAYNAEKYISTTINSVLQQTYTNFELIITDDCSTDKTLDIIQSFEDPRIKIVKNKTNKKLIETLNQMIDIAQGEFIARIDADDVCFLDRFEKQIQVFQKHKDIGLCGTNSLFIDESDNVLFSKQPFFNSDFNLNHEIVYWKLFFSENPFIHSSVMMKKSVLFSNNLRYDKAALHVEDIDLWVKMRDVCKLYILKEPLVKYRIIDSSISAKNNDTQIIKTMKISSKAILNYLENKKVSCLNSKNNQTVVLHQLFKHFFLTVKDLSAQQYILNDWIKRMVKLAIVGLPENLINSLNTFKILKKEKVKFSKIIRILMKLLLNKVNYIFSHINQYHR